MHCLVIDIGGDGSDLITILRVAIRLLFIGDEMLKGKGLLALCTEGAWSQYLTFVLVMTPRS